MASRISTQTPARPTLANPTSTPSKAMAPQTSPAEPEPFPRISSDSNVFSTFDSDATTHHETSADAEALYTEINIPLPHLPSPPRQSQPSTLSPPRSRSLSNLSFRRSSSSTTPGRLVKPSILKSREVAAAMDLQQKGRRGRSSTVDALAVVPAVLVLSAELFTPGAGEGGKRGRGDGGLVGGMR